MTRPRHVGPTGSSGRPAARCEPCPRPRPSSSCCSAGWPCGSLSHTSCSRPPASSPTSRTYVSWALTLARARPGGFYANAGFTDYPPGYLYVLWPIGLLADALGGADPACHGRRPSSSSRRCSLDIAVGYVLYRLVLGWAWPGRRAEALALGAAALYVFNPVTWYDSALWGQTDAAGALVLLLGVAALIRGNSEGAAALGVARGARQAAVRRGAHPAGRRSCSSGATCSDPARDRATRPGARRGCAAGWPASRDRLRLVTSARRRAGRVPRRWRCPSGWASRTTSRCMGSARPAATQYLTVNAYNPWALVGVGRATRRSRWAMPLLVDRHGARSLGAAARRSPSAPLLLVAGFLYGLVPCCCATTGGPSSSPPSSCASPSSCCPTRVHERYLFPVFALLPLLAVTSRAGWWRSSRSPSARSSTSTRS